MYHDSNKISWISTDDTHAQEEYKFGYFKKVFWNLENILQTPTYLKSTPLDMLIYQP